MAVLMKSDIKVSRPVFVPALLYALVLLGCSGGNNSSQTQQQHSGAPLSITTSSLPNGQVNHPYTARLSATGGTAPLSWAISSGALPPGLTLAASGAISGTPTAAAAGASISFTVTDSSANTQTKNVTLSLTVDPDGITVSVSPARAAVVATQSLTLTAATNDHAGVSWSITPAGGAFNAPSSASGMAVTLTAPSAAGVYTVRATSLTDGSQNASMTVAVTDLAGVYTYHNDLARDGANVQEYALTPKNVNSATFGKRFSCTVDGAIYAQPLWVAKASIGGSRHNVILVATQHDSVYAFDADATPCVQLWKANLIDTSHGANPAEVTVTASIGTAMPVDAMAPEVGVAGTPVIDPATGVLYAVSMSTNTAGPTSPTGGASFYERLHAIDLTTGNEKPGSPVLIAATYPGTASGGSTVAFNPVWQQQRTGLALVNGTVYVACGSFGDFGPWYGWVMGYTYNGKALLQSSVFNVAPNTGGGGIWMSGGAPAADSNGNIYVTTGNGPADTTATSGPTNDYGDSVLKLSGSLTVKDWFLPSAYATLGPHDLDLASGGAIVVNAPGGPIPHLLITGGKDGTLYVLNADHLGNFGDSNAVQYFSIGTGGVNRIFATPAFWNNTLFIAPIKQPMLAYTLDTSTGKLNSAAPSSRSPTLYGFPGSTPSVSASGTDTNGVLWAIDNTGVQDPCCGPAVLRAYDATNLATELWNSAKNPADAAGKAVRFTVPTVANGKVYVGTRGNNTGGVYGSTSVAGELDVYGLNPN